MQAAQVKEELASIFRYLARLRDRLKAVGYSEDYNHYRATYEAHDPGF